jgi:acetylornithine deacetylase/succinyl-diaminopimelate desuccinylase-like protein
MNDDLRAAVAADMPRLKDLLSELVRMPSVSAPGFDKAEVRKAGEMIVSVLEDAGFQNSQLLEVEGGNPAVFGELPAPEGAPTILLYAHYDVQPPGPASEWQTAPYDPVEKNGRVFGRGSADDKSGVVMHLGAVAAFNGQLPVGVQVFFEGEEEAGSESLAPILEKYSDLLRPDVIVIGDGGVWTVDVPAFLTSLRGIVATTIEIRTLDAAVHSGDLGGAFPDALTAMARLLATLHDDDGNVAIPGLVSEETDGLAIPEEMARTRAGVVDGVTQIGTGSISSRLWTRPAISVLALDAPPVSEAINQLVPVSRAKVSMRVAPDQDTAVALAALKRHLTENAPWGAKVEFLHEEAGHGSVIAIDNNAVDAWTAGYQEAFGTTPVAMGTGGSIPFISTFAELYPDSPILVIGCADPTSAYHAPNESVDLGVIEKSVLAEAIAFRLLGAKA